jgi:light-regulated signal transduction histidine kinase (bacteriophytochrome)
LRSINGYAKILADELGEMATDEQKRLTEIIQNNAIKMGILIDDLLSFSRMGRKELHKTTCNVNDIISSLLSEMHDQITDKYSISVNKLPDCMADPALIRQVWMNFISNAVKYSSKRESPKISIEYRAQDDEIIYFIKDNGAGFDMKYVDKIFGVFQRLHTSDEFEGTGVGLAIVQRIITKHGGRVWVEAEPDAGATYYFSLPNETGEL